MGNQKKEYAFSSSNCAHLTYCRPYELAESRVVEMGLGVTVCGDVTVGLFHARSTLGAKVQGRFAALPIFRLSFHTGLVDPATTLLEFTLPELDELDDDLAKYPDSFK